MQFKVFEPGIEVSGNMISSTIEGFKRYPSVVMKYLARFGIISKSQGKPEDLNRDGWYKLDDWLAAYEHIANEVGVNSLYGIGKSVPENAVFPPHISDIHSAIASIDAAYHMNHRKNGALMFNPETGQMLDGIGHYRYQPVANERRIICVCENPYPCEFDRGLVSAMAARFEPLARTVHDNEAPCRKKAADSCTLIVSW
jgi:hypothetical protein